MSSPNSESAQPCGCDPGCKPNPHFCELHRDSKFEIGSSSASEGPQHTVNSNGVCTVKCYACERKGLQERVKFTADYETIKAQVEILNRFIEAFRLRADAAEAQRDKLLKLQSFDY